MSHIFEYNLFLKELSAFQEKMLLLEIENSQSGFNTLYQNAIQYFKKLYEQNESTGPGDERYLVKKQSELILSYLKELSQINLVLSKMNEVEIIKLFEKQRKLKKIVLKLINSL